MRAAAVAAEASIKKSSRFSPCSVNELTSWDPTYEYEKQDQRHKKMVVDAYTYSTLRDAISAGLTPQKPSQIAEDFMQLGDDERDLLCARLATLHAAIAYSLWAVLIPFYVAERSRMGSRAHHWTPLEPDSTIRSERLHTYTKLKSAMASDYIKGVPHGVELIQYYDWQLDPDDERLRYFLDRDFSVEGDSASAGGNSTQTIRGVASSFVRTMWTAVVVLGREPHPISAVRPLTSNEWCILVKGHGIPEDILTGTRVSPPLNYEKLASDGNSFTPCKEFGFIVSMTEDAFYSDIFMTHAFFAMRALNMANECTKDGVDRAQICRQVFSATSENTTAGFNNNIAAVFGALKKGGAERFRPDATDLAAIRAYMPSADLSWLETSGQALTYSVYKYLDAFREDFLTTRRRLRADITVGRALDRGGLKSKKAAGRLPSTEDDGLRDMMRALRGQIWSPVWKSVIQPWLRTLNLAGEPQNFLLTSAQAVDEGNIVKLADDKGFTKGDAERLQLLLMLHLSCLRSQVWRDSVVEEFELQQRDGRAFYSFSMTRAFKTAACKEDGGMPHLAKWELSETESLLVHTVLTLCRPMLSAGTKRTSRMFLDSNGSPVTQRWIESKVAQVGCDWLGVPRLGPHTLRTMWISWMVNSGLVAEEDFDSLAAYVQVSRCTMLESYVVASHSGPAQRVGQALRDGGLNAAVRTHGSAILDNDTTTSEEDTASTGTSATLESIESADTSIKPYGKALGAKRKPYRDNILLAVTAHGGDAKRAFDSLVAKRKLGQLSSQEQWFRESITFFRDADLPAFKKMCTK
jgi:hypothetical protein